ncbi:MAG: hypothetical protein RLZZ397_449 [Pseudomonadota bacterium]|jgi:iron(III) transport system ATP-binding protein
MSTELTLDQVSITYPLPKGECVAVSGAHLHLQAGEIGCLLGPSGCGKTSLLRAIAGFEPVSQGQIMMHNQVVSSKQHWVAPEHRRIGMVFQEHALFPHLDVAGNVGFGLRQWKAADKRERINTLLDWVGLSGLGHRAIHELSGGQQQRVALARALAPQPDLLLMDEPFSSLDATLRERLAREVRDILKASGTTALLVTHDQHEAFAMADRIGVMRQGQLLQWDTPLELYHHPADTFVAEFVGEGVFIDGTMTADGGVRTELGDLLPTVCTYSSTHDEHPFPEPGQAVKVLVRPDDIRHDDDSEMRAQVSSRVFRGAEFLYTLALPSGQTVLALASSHHDHQVGESIGITLDMHHVLCFGKTAA